MRSLERRALFVTFALYLDELGWQASSIGLLLSAGGFLNAALSLPIGMVSDRSGRKRFVVANEVIVVLAAVAATFSSHPALLTAASLLGAFGRGQVGMIGPAGPAEQAWIAELVDPLERGRVFTAPTPRSAFSAWPSARCWPGSCRCGAAFFPASWRSGRFFSWWSSPGSSTWR